MKTVSSNEAQQELQRILRLVVAGKTRAVIEKDGRPVAAIISAADLQQLERSDAQRQDDFTIFEEISQAFKDEPLARIEHEVAKAVREAREEQAGDPSSTPSTP
jgi:prevent-host-death family protein